MVRRGETPQRGGVREGEAERGLCRGVPQPPGGLCALSSQELDPSPLRPAVLSPSWLVLCPAAGGKRTWPGRWPMAGVGAGRPGGAGLRPAGVRGATRGDTGMAERHGCSCVGRLVCVELHGQPAG